MSNFHDNNTNYSNYNHNSYYYCYYYCRNKEIIICYKTFSNNK